jgi:predicted transcriptional regulator
VSDEIYGAVGVLAYDAGADRVQCHVCGAWFKKLTSFHLARHGLSISGYKERFGLGPRTPLESPPTTTRRRRATERGVADQVQLLADDTLYGEIGVLAYDPLLDRIQCHGCGRWFHKLTSFHLARHGLSIAEYKERFGLNAGTALETPRIGELRRWHNARNDNARLLIPAQKGAPPPGGTHPNVRRAEYLRRYHTPEHFAARAQRQRRWSDAEMLNALRRLQAERGGYLRITDLRATRPTAQTVVRRFGSWKRVCELLGQPDRAITSGPPPGTPRQWSDAELLAALRAIQAREGGILTVNALRQYSSGRKGHAGAAPTYKTVRAQLGSWRRVCELLGQPFFPPGHGQRFSRTGRPLRGVAKGGIDSDRRPSSSADNELTAVSLMSDHRADG